MGAGNRSDGSSQDGRTKVERKSERELVTTRMFAAPARLVFEAWTKAELFKRWWAPKSMGVPMLDCMIDARTGGGYKVVFGHDAANSMAFFGRYMEVTPPLRLVWTNEESADGPVTTVTFEERGSLTFLTVHELYPSKEALDASFDGMETTMPEQFVQLDELLAAQGAH